MLSVLRVFRQLLVIDCALFIYVWLFLEASFECRPEACLVGSCWLLLCGVARSRVNAPAALDAEPLPVADTRWELLKPRADLLIASRSTRCANVWAGWLPS